uniref:Dehydrogenase/reductase (SDR family) member 13a, tandem duplicate 2 n=1 Tax=Lates calcarifer TaxID=8187 RepID=A0A4W6DG87_LATCA
MFHLLLLAGVLLGGYIVLIQTLFKRSKCRGNAAMAGKTVVITGGNTGIGKATALHLARKGARVILACRNRDKAEAAIADIQQETGSTDVLYMHLDLASLKSVRCFAETFLKTESRLDLLINNAGLVADGRTEDGFGIEFGVNHLGHFLLTCLLLERLKEAGGGRVITLSSMAHRWGHIDFEVSSERKTAYCNSKLCNVLFTHELAKRLKGTNVTCYSLHPGVVRTELSRHVSLWQKIFIEPVARLLFLDPEAGAQTTLHCALQEGIEPLSGRYFSCCAVQEVCARARDDAVARKLWEVSERLFQRAQTSVGNFSSEIRTPDEERINVCVVQKQHICPFTEPQSEPQVTEEPVDCGGLLHFPHYTHIL